MSDDISNKQLRGDFKKLEDDFKELKGDFKELKGDFEELKADFKALSKDIGEKYEKLIDKIDAKFDAANERFYIGSNRNLTATIISIAIASGFIVGYPTLFHFIESKLNEPNAIVEQVQIEQDDE